jgi:hypothetical protein
MTKNTVDHLLETADSLLQRNLYNLEYDILAIDKLVKEKFEKELSSVSSLQDTINTLKQFLRNDCLNIIDEGYENLINIIDKLEKRLDDIETKESYSFYLLHSYPIIKEYESFKLPAKKQFFSSSSTSSSSSLKKGNGNGKGNGGSIKNVNECIEKYFSIIHSFFSINVNELKNRSYVESKKGGKKINDGGGNKESSSSIGGGKRKILQKIVKGRSRSVHDEKNDKGIFTDFCKVCEGKSTFMRVPENQTIVCCDCGSEISDITMYQTYKDTNRINITSKYKYDETGHFKDCMNEYQAKQNKKIPKSVYSALINQFKQHRLLVNPDDFKVLHFKRSEPFSIQKFLDFFSKECKIVASGTLSKFTKSVWSTKKGWNDDKTIHSIYYIYDLQRFTIRGYNTDEWKKWFSSSSIEMDPKIRYFKIKKNHITRFLEYTDNSQYYKDFNYIYYQITTHIPPNISHIEDELKQDFKDFLKVYVSMPDEFKKRYILPNYNFIFFQILRKRGMNPDPNDFNLLTTLTCIDDHNHLCDAVFERLGWKYKAYF